MPTRLITLAPTAMIGMRSCNIVVVVVKLIEYGESRNLGAASKLVPMKKLQNHFKTTHLKCNEGSFECGIQPATEFEHYTIIARLASLNELKHETGYVLQRYLCLMPLITRHAMKQMHMPRSPRKLFCKVSIKPDRPLFVLHLRNDRHSRRRAYNFCMAAISVDWT
jgi:hypothetical protein